MKLSVKGGAPNVFITPLAKQKLDLYIYCCKDEISGFGTVDEVDDGFLITDVFILKQECSSANSDMDSKDVSTFLVEAVKSGFDPSKIKLFWHSHADSGVFWSGTDDRTIDELSESWLISIVGNRSLNYLVRLDLYGKIRFTADDIGLQVIGVYDEELRKQVEAEIEEKVTTRAYAYYSSYRKPKGGSDNYYCYDDWDWVDGVWQKQDTIDEPPKKGKTKRNRRGAAQFF